MADLGTQTESQTVVFQKPGLRSSRAGFFSDTSEGTVADRDTTDAETDWTDWEVPQRTTTGRKPEVFPFLTSSDQRTSTTTGRVTRAAAIVSDRTRAPKRSSRNGRLSPISAQETGPSKRRKDDSEFSEAESGPRFACPFFKRDPQKYKTHRTCPGPGWQTVHRVKEHIYRRHSQPVYCPKCYQIFSKDSVLNTHLRSDHCPILASEPPEGLTSEQKEKLKKRGLPSHSEDERWREMFRIIFPDVAEHDMPSPYHGDQTDGNEPVPFRQELLRRVRRELLASSNGKATEAEEKVMKQVADIVRRCESELLQDNPPTNPAMPSSDLANEARSMPSSEYWPSTAGEESDVPSAGFGTDSDFPHYPHGALTAIECSPTPAARETPTLDLDQDYQSIADGLDWHVNFDEWIISGHGVNRDDQAESGSSQLVTI